MARYRILWGGKWDFRRLNREFRELGRQTALLWDLVDAAQAGDRVALKAMSDLAEEHGFPGMANVLRTSAWIVRAKPDCCKRRRHV